MAQFDEPRPVWYVPGAHGLNTHEPDPDWYVLVLHSRQPEEPDPVAY